MGGTAAENIVRRQGCGGPLYVLPTNPRERRVDHPNLQIGQESPSVRWFVELGYLPDQRPHRPKCPKILAGSDSPPDACGAAWVRQSPVCTGTAGSGTAPLDSSSIGFPAATANSANRPRASKRLRSRRSGGQRSRHQFDRAPTADDARSVNASGLRREPLAGVNRLSRIGTSSRLATGPIETRSIPCRAISRQ